MSKREVKLYLQDIRDCIKKIERYTKNLSFNAFKRNDEKIDAIVRNLEIIGEAAKNIPQKVRNQYPDVFWRDVVDMRNEIAHEYFGVVAEIIWKTVQKRIPELKKGLRKKK
ncbi:DUF86 domain-containing protein [Candidatus Parcubacteria bacterium]|nr:DUF86 domain-containing protein [Candidatus Parcubacteria bacterium]